MKNKKIIYLLSFIIPVILLIAVLFIKGIGFNAEKILVSDMHSQYVTLFLYLKRVLNGTESLFYSFNNGLGGSMYATFAYYLASPLNLLLIFFSENNIPEFIMLILFIKIGLCGLTMNIYINRHFKLKFDSLIFSCCYALMAYVINYYFNIMWLDGVYLLPLVMLGIDKLLKENKFLLYIISLFLAIFSNFYIGYMICIFSCIYFIQELLLNYKKTEYKKKIFIFIKYSILAGLLASFLLIPTFMEIMNFSRNTTSIVETNILNSITQFFTSFYIGTHHCTNLVNYYGTFIYCGIFITMNFLLYFFNKNIEKKEKIISLIVFIFLFLSSIITLFRYIWHGFSYPNSFNNRFSFIISFYMIFLAIKNYMKFDKKNITPFIIYIIVGIILLFQNYEFHNINNLILSIMLMCIYYLIIHLIRKIKLRNIIIFIFVIFELIINTFLCFNYNKSNNVSFKYFYNNFCNNLIYDNEYRLDQNYLYGGLDGLLCGYSGITIYLSTNNVSKYNISNNFGYDTSHLVSTNELKNTPISDSLLGIKYIYSNFNSLYDLNDTNIKIKYYSDENILSNEQFNLYLNNYALKIGYLVDDINVEFVDYFDYQNEILKKFSGIDKNSLEKIEIEKLTNTKYKINDDGIIFVKIYYDQDATFFNEEIYDIYLDNKKQQKKNYSIFYLKKGIMEIRNIAKFINIEKIEFYKLNEEIFEEQINKLKKNQVKVNKKEKNVLNFDINVKKNGKLLITLPYEKGWKIYDSNKEIKYKKILNGFIEIDLNKGSHNIKMIYKPLWLKLGIFISLISLTIIIIELYRKRRNYIFT